VRVAGRIRDLARRQHWVLSYAQLRQLGLTRSAIAWRVRRGWVQPLHRGVYLVDHRIPPPLAAEAAALLAVGRTAVLSHQTAAYLDKLLPHPARPVHVTVIGRAPAQRRNLRIHRTTTLERKDVRRHEGLPLTCPARTLLDLSAVVTTSELEPLVAEAQRRRLVSEPALRDQLTRHAGRPGTAALRALIESPGGPAFTRSTAERKLLALIRAARLPPPRSNQKVGGFEVDLLWPEQRLVAEFDSFTFHGDRVAFERDRHRDGVLQAHGYAVVRVTWRQLTSEPQAVVALLARMLERRSRRAG
jgi:very-short-patch-repair endonuclease